MRMPVVGLAVGQRELDAMRETLAVPSARLAVTLLPPLVQVRVLRFPRLRLPEIGGVITRDVAKYFPDVRVPQVVAVSRLPGGRAGNIAVLVAVAPAWILEGISEAAHDAGCTIVSFEPAHVGWARWAGIRSASLVVVTEGTRAELIRTERGRLLEVRRIPVARIDATLAEMGGGAAAVFGEAESAEAAEIAALHAGANMELELVSDSEVAARSRRTRRLAMRLWAAVAAGLVLALGLHRTVLLHELGVLENGRAAQRMAVESALAAREASLGVRARLDALAETETGAHSWSAILNELASGLPGDSYLTSLRGTADSIVIDGVARRAAGVFEGLQSATRLTAVRPAGPIRQEVRDSGPPIERFTASATLRPAP